MSLPATPQTRRGAVLAALMVWLFAIAAGWATACLVQEHDAHGHESGGGAAKAVCLQVCDEGTQSLVKWRPGLDLNPLGLAPPASFMWSALTASPAAARGTAAWPAPVPGLPLRTRFSRLAL